MSRRSKRGDEKEEEKEEKEKSRQDKEGRRKEARKEWPEHLEWFYGANMPGYWVI